MLIEIKFIQKKSFSDTMDRQADLIVAEGDLQQLFDVLNKEIEINVKKKCICASLYLLCKFHIIRQSETRVKIKYRLTDD